MSGVPLCGNLWAFRRDEFDLLEEAFEDTMERHEMGRGKKHACEAIVIREQEASEKASEAELTARLGVGWQEVSEGPCHVHGHEESLKSLRERVQEGVRHPLYLQSLTWCLPLQRWSEAAYAKKPQTDLYRILLNAPLIPIKIFFALCEEEHDDRFAPDVAEREYALAQTSAERILEALVRLQAAGYLPASSDPAQKMGRNLIQSLAECRRRLRRL